VLPDGASHDLPITANIGLYESIIAGHAGSRAQQSIADGHVQRRVRFAPRTHLKRSFPNLDTSPRTAVTLLPIDEAKAAFRAAWEAQG
jgi:hypothetical protein